jgi:hypothetical protein
MNKVEFFGISGSGKTFFKTNIESKLKEKKIITYSYKQVIEEFLPHNERNILNYFLLKVFFFFRKNTQKNFYLKNDIPSKNIHKKSLFQGLKKKIFRVYEKNLENIFKKNKEKKFSIITLDLIRKSNFSQKNKLIFIRWFKEEIAANYLINKNLNKAQFIIDSEGFIQRLFIYLYKKKNKKQIANLYLRYCPMPSLLIVMDKKMIKKKVFSNKEFNMDYKELFKIYEISLKILNRNKRLKIINKKNFKLSYL